MARFYLEKGKVAAFIAHLQSQKPVYAPHRKGRNAFAFAPVERPQDVVLDYPRTVSSIKKYFMPAREELLSFNLVENTCAQPAVAPLDAVFLGVHSYDVQAVLKLDHNFVTGNPERNYLTRRQGALFVGVGFTPDRFHFSGSVGIPAGDTSGCDLFLHHCEGGYALETLTPAGEGLIAGFKLPAHTAGLPAAAAFQQHIYVPQAKLKDVLAHGYDAAVWEEEAEKCVSCGTCNLVCPTCYCFDVEDEVDITATRGSRERHWDGCLLRSFTEVAGGEVFREEPAARQRHRVFRKFKYISDETGEPWCVGCGRCTAACTAGISIVSIVNRLVNDYDAVKA